MGKIHLGIIGTGRIAERFVKEASVVEAITLSAIYNPRIGSAQRFLEKVSAQSSDGEIILEECIATEDWDSFIDHTDAVYIASPHQTHYNHIKSALLAKKHVLCEKPMVLNKSEAEEVFALAKEKNLVLLEAIKTAYAPGFLEIVEKVRGGAIGTVRDIECCFTKLENPQSRELTDAVYGGSFLELGSYVLLPIFTLYETQFEEVRFDSIKGENGLDLYTKASFRYQNGLALGKTGLGVKSEGQLLIAGTKGYIRVEAPWWKTSRYEICYEDWTKNQKYQVEFEGDGLRYELQEFVRRISGQEVLAEQEEIVATAMAGVMERFLGVS